MEGTGAIEKLSQLEERIAQTTERFSHLKNQYQALQDQKETLELEIDRLRSANRELADSLGRLRSNHEKLVGSFQKEEVRKRLDRVLEKLGELQL
ncbi:MAG TPA: cell division protein ZapB [Candidatus Krumholzibacteria bacterium]|nr:cell division protein ZapB [Candidatus Krumholzibacteria bacterium]